MDNIKKLFPMDFKKNNIIYYYIPYFLLISWIFFSIISIFFIDIKLINNGFVIFSIFMHIIISITSGYFFYSIFIKQNHNKKQYNIFRAFVGYGVIFTYVFYSLPRIVGEYLGHINFTSAVINYLIILFISIFPSILYLFLRQDKVKLIFEFYNKKEIDYENKIKTDKVLKKKEHHKIISQRGFWTNLWYEWIDVIIQAIIIALIIQQFIFQMYQIPSESMVPTFLKQDRVMVNKLIFGPHIPLTEWKLPSPFKPKVGDIVVFINPKIDDPTSEIRYNNVFARIFHPFIYMLTLSIVDIDKKSNGEPKERFIVKRCISKAGEKICMVNDIVYKKTKDTDWMPMSEIKGQKEYGQVNLYYSENPNMDSQFMTKNDRKLLDDAQILFEKYNIKELENQLINEKENFRILLTKNGQYLKNNSYNDFTEYQKKYMSKVSSINNYIYDRMAYLYSRHGLSNSELMNIEKSYSESKDKIQYCLFYQKMNEINKILNDSNNDYNYIINQIITTIEINENDSPYTEYMKRINALYKIYSLKMFSAIIESYIAHQIETFFGNEEKLYNSIYNNTLRNYYLIDNYTENYIFDKRNFSDYPKDANEYIKTDEYFMMGDNRYNSADSRFGDSTYDEFLDYSDNTIFAKRLRVSWGPHTIKMKYILGKAIGIYWPLDRLKIFW